MTAEPLEDPPQDETLLDPAFEDHILSVCAALGGMELDEATGQDRYILGDECLDCLRDLKRFLREDNRLPDKPLLRALGHWQLAQTDILPIFLLTAQGKSKEQGWLTGACVELLVPMTWPLEKKAPHYIERNNLLWKLKELCLAPPFLPSLFRTLLRLLAIPGRERTLREDSDLRLTLTLVRNLLAIKDPILSALDGSGRDVFERSRMQENLIIGLGSAKILDLLIATASSCKNIEVRAHKGIILECILLALQSTDPTTLRTTPLPRLPKSSSSTTTTSSSFSSSASTTPAPVKKIDMDERYREAREILGRIDWSLDDAIYKPSSDRQASRHSRFGGALEVVLPDKTHLPLTGQAGGGSTFHSDSHPRKVNLPRNSARAKNKPDLPRVQDYGGEAAWTLKRMADSFLESCFNTIIPLRQAELDRQAMELEMGIEVDHINWLSLVDFCLAYLLSIGDKMNAKDLMRVSSVLNKKVALYVERRMQMSLDEKRYDELYAAVGVYRHILLGICHLSDIKGSEECRLASQSLQDSLFYEKATLDFIKSLCHTTGYTDLRYLDRLFELVHLLVHLLENYVRSHSDLYVRKQVRSTRRKSTKRRKALDQVGSDDEVIEEDQIDTGDGFINAEEAEEEEAREKERRREVKEQRFDFDSFVRSFGQESTVNMYIGFLRGLLDLNPGDHTKGCFSDRSVHHVANMLHRVYDQCNIRGVFWRVSSLRVLQRILQRYDRPTTRPDSPEGQLVRFAKMCLQHFFLVHRKYPLLLVEALFPKTRGISRFIQETVEMSRAAKIDRQVAAATATEAEDPLPPPEENMASSGDPPQDAIPAALSSLPPVPPVDSIPVREDVENVEWVSL